MYIKHYNILIELHYYAVDLYKIKCYVQIEIGYINILYIKCNVR